MSTLLPISARNLLRRTADYIGVQVDDLIGPCRSDKLARARFAVMAELRAKGWSYPRIAAAVGHRDHTTIIHGVGMARKLMGNSQLRDPDFIDLVAHLRGPESHEAIDFVPGVTDAGPSRAAPAVWPYPGHGTLADQNAAQEVKRTKWRDQYARERKSLRRPLAVRKAG